MVAGRTVGRAMRSHGLRPSGSRFESGPANWDKWRTL